MWSERKQAYEKSAVKTDLILCQTEHKNTQQGGKSSKVRSEAGKRHKQVHIRASHGRTAITDRASSRRLEQGFSEKDE